MVILLIVFHAKYLPINHPTGGTGNARLLEQRNNVKSHKIEPKVSSIVRIQTNSTPLLYGKKAQKNKKKNKGKSIKRIQRLRENRFRREEKGE